MPRPEPRGGASPQHPLIPHTLKHDSRSVHPTEAVLSEIIPVPAISKSRDPLGPILLSFPRRAALGATCLWPRPAASGVLSHTPGSGGFSGSGLPPL